MENYRVGYKVRIKKVHLKQRCLVISRQIFIFGKPGYYPKHVFKNCSCFNITTTEGKNFDAFMGIELISGGLRGGHGKFYEATVFENLKAEEVEEFDKNFPQMEKLRLPGQWMYVEE